MGQVIFVFCLFSSFLFADHPGVVIDKQVLSTCYILPEPKTFDPNHVSFSSYFTTETRDKKPRYGTCGEYEYPYQIVDVQRVLVINEQGTELFSKEENIMKNKLEMFQKCLTATKEYPTNERVMEILGVALTMFLDKYRTFECK